MCDLEVVGEPTIFKTKTICIVTTLSRMVPTFDLRCEGNTTHEYTGRLRKVKSSRCKKDGQFPEDLVKIEGVQTS